MWGGRPSFAEVSGRLARCGTAPASLADLTMWLKVCQEECRYNS